MKKHPNTSNIHPTSYDSPGLGRDDPVWPQYVREAAEWDAQLVERWHKGMDNILLFAALFSAIVTAFLIESYKLLKVDNEEIIASGIPAMVGLLQSIATSQPPSVIVEETSSPMDFKATRASVVINAAWFLSLTLSISVALLAILVKQWGDKYRRHDLSPPGIQARIRQSRYESLEWWKTEDIALALPVLMHTALGLFLLGLVVFLYELNRIILVLVLIVVASTFVVYLGTTLMPLFVAFCPYDTPLSSRRYLTWFLSGLSYVINFCNYIIRNKTTRFTLPLGCQQKEWSVSLETRPDELTARALEWLIGHSKNKNTVDIAIRAISSTVLGTQVHEYLAQDSLIKLLAQKFTAIFNGILDEEHYSSSMVKVNNVQLSKAALYGRALANVTQHIKICHASYHNVQSYSTHKGSDAQTVSISLMKDQIKAIERGLFLVASSKDPAIASSGVTSLSSWYTSTTRAAQSRDKWMKMLIRLIELLSGSNLGREVSAEAPGLVEAHRNQPVQEDIEGNTNQGNHQITEGDTLNRIVHALLLELAHWRWDISKQERQTILEPLIGLFSLPILEGRSRAGMSAVLAVFAILFHDHPEFPAADDDWIYLPDSGPEAQKRSSGNQETSLENPQPSKSERRSELALRVAHICQKNDDYMRKYADALIFFGLAGLLDSVSALGLSSMTEQIVAIVTTQLNKISGGFTRDPILLPSILPLSVDARAFMADAITRSLSPSPFKGQLQPIPDEQKAALLECLWDKSYLWSDFGHQFLMPVVQLLHISQDQGLQSQCLVALNEYCFTQFSSDQFSSPYHDPVQMDWKFFFSLDIPYRLVEIMQANETIRSKAVTAFSSIMQMIPITVDDDNRPNLDPDTKNQISTAMCRLATGDLLGVFAEAVLYRYGHLHVQAWRNELTNLPIWLQSTEGQNSELIMTKLHQFYTESVKKPGHMALLALGLADKLDKESLQPQHETPIDS
ncbi:putative transmembrane protein [Rhizoctonia solani 123E]|uniref:Putative transmembrane protein n=1 Tax=Rhizoctonia solani 123E TaxID=1423351 RepID=A0A074S8M0_9AGAM|nr:putative transmembrane protein [Rhizoctonia solani 123E]